MTQRDRYVIGVIALLALFGGFWFLALGPKRDKLTTLDKRVVDSRASVESAKQEAQLFAKARLEFPNTYATVVRLGKAAPANPEMPSLLVQLERAARQGGVDFRKITVENQGAPATGGPSAAPPPAASGATGTSGPQGSASSGGGGSAGATSSASSSPAVPAVAANAQSVATAPLGTVVGPAGLPVLRLSLTFQGSFFKMADFVHNVRQLVKERNNTLVISGRLLTLDAIAFGPGDAGFPQVKAAIAATAYLVPATQGLLAGASPTGPGGAVPTTPAPVASGGGSTPAPQAAVKIR